LNKNSNVPAWRTSNLTGVNRYIIEHKLQDNASTKPRMQRPYKTPDKKVAAAKVEVQGLLDAGFTREVQYPRLLANVVFFQVIKAPSVRTVDPEPRIVHVMQREDWQAMIMAYLCEHHEPSSSTELTTMQ
jgi:hypothetical protein